VKTEGKNAIANIVGSCLGWNLRVVFRDCRTIFPKRFARHALVGKVFVASMLTMALGAVYRESRSIKQATSAAESQPSI
jgi:hypothetical protein